MSEKVRAFSKKYGTRKEVVSEIAAKTRGGLTADDLFIDNEGVIRSVKQQESLKKSSNNLIKKEKKVVEEVHTDASDSDTPNGTPAVPAKAMNINDLKEAVRNHFDNNNQSMPKGYSKWKKQQWIEQAKELQIVC